MWPCWDMKHEWPILLRHRVTLAGHTRYVNWHGGCHMVMLGHSRREWACLHHQVAALGPSWHAKLSSAGGAGTQEAHKRAYPCCNMVVVVTADIQTGVPVPPCVGSGTWQVHKHACIARWQCRDTAGMQIGTFALPGSRTSCENLHCHSAVQDMESMQTVCLCHYVAMLRHVKGAEIRMVALGHGMPCFHLAGLGHSQQTNMHTHAAMWRFCDMQLCKEVSSLLLVVLA